MLVVVGSAEIQALFAGYHKGRDPNGFDDILGYATVP